jgi:hypothetical protein
MFRSARSRFAITLGVSVLAFVLSLVDPADADLDTGATPATPLLRR